MASMDTGPASLYPSSALQRTIQMPLDVPLVFQRVAAVVALTSTFTALYKKYQAPPTTKDGLPLPPGPPPRRFWELALPTSK